MKVSEFWGLLQISSENSRYFDENIKLLSSNQLSYVKQKIEADIAEYEKLFGESKGKTLTKKKRDFAELHFSAIKGRVETFLKINREFENEAMERKLKDEQEEKERRQKHFNDLIGRMEHKEKVVCPHCHGVGGVYVQKRVDIIKTRVNSLPARIIGLGTNTAKSSLRFVCTNCEMEWGADA